MLSAWRDQSGRLASRPFEAEDRPRHDDLARDMEFFILGPLEARANGDPVPLGGPKQRALLAILLLNANRVVSRAALIDELWGDQPAARGAHALDVQVSRLRTVLGADGGSLLSTRPPGYGRRACDRQLPLARR